MSAIETFRYTSGSGHMVGEDESTDHQLAALHALQHEHPFWTCRLLCAFAQGALSRDDIRHVFSQYHLYTLSYTRFIAAIMANCESDLLRAQLAQNLWEEGGGREPSRRHAQLFRNFLRDSLGISDLEQIAYAPHTRHFVREYLAQSQHVDPVASAAFLAIGTEGIVSRMYQIMRVGLAGAAISEADLEFFDLHIAYEDDRAVIIENIMMLYAAQPGWFETCEAALRRALDLRMEFFDALYDDLQRARLRPIVQRMQDRESLARGRTESDLHHCPGGTTIATYGSDVARHNIEFTVEHLPLTAEVLDPRIVRIPAGKFNEKHKHAHETLIHILEGSGQVLVDDRILPVSAGDSVLVPRWAMHQTQNLGTTEMRFLAVTDFRLSQRMLICDAGDYRLYPDIDAGGRH